MTRILIALTALLFTACVFGDDNSGTNEITRSFWVTWSESKKDKHVIYSVGEYGITGTTIVNKTVFAVGFDDNFIIVKQHPFLKHEPVDSLGNIINDKQNLEVRSLTDTISVPEYDSIAMHEGKWYYVGGKARNLADSLVPIKNITYYHIIDMRNMDPNWRTPHIKYTFDNEANFEKKRKALGVPPELTFNMFDDEFF